MSIIALDPTRADFNPLHGDQDEPTILGRMIGWANEGLDPVEDSAAWTDTREGSHWRTAITPGVREKARIYDLMGTEVPMSGMVLWSWGTYLDDLAAVWQVERNAATVAAGFVTFTGPAGVVIAVNTTVSANPSTPDDPAPDFRVTQAGVIPGGGSVTLPVVATEPGRAGNVAANAITLPSTPLPSGVTFTNANPTSTGSDPENDESLRDRLLQAIAGKGPGAVRDYVRWARQYPGVGSVKVIPIWNGPGTVLVLVSDIEGQPLASAVVNGLQALLDPVAGLGHGIAPIGAHVDVETPTLLGLVMAATLTYETGYSWDGTGGAIAAGPAILNAINAYLLSIPPGGEVVFEHVKGIVATGAGIHDVTAFTIDPGTGPAAVNVPISLTPPKAPYLETFTAS